MPSFLDAPVSITQPTKDGTWRDVDLSENVPAGATGVIIEVINGNASVDRDYGLRKNGSTDNRVSAVYRNGHVWAYIGVDTDRVIEMNIPAASTDLTFDIHGYFGSEAVFFDNATDVSTGLTGVQDIDISSNTGTDTAIGVIVEFESANNDIMYVRKNGSANTYTRQFFEKMWYLVGVDGNEIFECRTYDTVNTAIYLVGYVTEGMTFDTSHTDVTPTGVGSYEDLATLDSGALGGFYYLETSSTSEIYGIRPDGSSRDIAKTGSYQKGCPLVKATSQVIEGKKGSSGAWYKLGVVSAEAILGGSAGSSSSYVTKPKDLWKPT